MTPDIITDGSTRSAAYTGWYARYIFPYIEIAATSGLAKIRRRLLSHARGRVVEIGAGAAQNMAFLPETVHPYFPTDPSPVMVSKAKQRLLRRRSYKSDAQVIRAAAERMPIKDETADTVISFLVLCSVQDPSAALSEIHRLLRPEGRFLFFEHVLAARTSTIRWQNRITPLWKRIGGGCHLNRKTSDYIEQGGFRFIQLQRYRSQKMGPAITSNVIEGIAAKNDP
ncbi:MAG: class I SAM-dependent methyltransferase [Deltaproteobacteria bacterium]|nr:class I SAM-dependent methyltransferase [Deltaproteobacteria bacterium]